MLSPEVAKKRLDEWRVEREDGFLPEVKRLPAKLRPIGYGLMRRDAKGKEFELDNWQENMRAAREAVRPLDQLPVKDRLEFFATFFAGLAPAVEAAWQALKTGPYQEGFSRKSFRAPGQSEASFGARVSWLTQMIPIASRYQSDVLTPAWLAAWAPHLEEHYGSDQVAIGRLLAAVIDQGGDEAEEVFEILCQSIRNEHEIGRMGHHAVRALLMAARADGWELVEKTLLAAQRQEGLRQTILETVDEAHPMAYRRMLRLIRDHDLARFSAVVRAANVWFGLAWDSVSVKTVNTTIDTVLTLLDDHQARQKAITGRDPERVYLALWSMAYDDAPATIPVAANLFKDKRVEIRFVAAVHLSQLGLPQAHGVRAVALDDEDLRVALCALGGVVRGEDDEADELEGGEGLFERLERLFARVPEKPAVLKPLVWPWTERKVSREEVSQYLVASLGRRPPTALVPYLPSLSPWHRSAVVENLAAQKKWDGLTRETLVRLVGDSASDVREAACKSLGKVKLQPEEIERLEGYLTRKTSDLRQGVTGLLLNQPDPQALKSAERLLAAKDAMQRLAGLELLRQMAAAKRCRGECQERVAQYQASRKKLSKEEQGQIDAVLGASAETLSLDDALGLMNPAERSPVIPVKSRKVQFLSAAAVACLSSLDELVNENRETPIKFKTWQGEDKEDLLGNVSWGFPSPDWDKPPEAARENLPLANVWEQWYAERAKALRDKDGFELLRAEVWLEVSKSEWEWKSLQEWCKESADRKKIFAMLSGGQARAKLKYPHIIDDLVSWLLFLHQPAGAVDFLLDAVETSFSLVSESEMKKLVSEPSPQKNAWEGPEDWRNDDPMMMWLKQLQGYVARHRITPAPEQAARWWRLVRWLDEPAVGARRHRPDFARLSDAYELGAATVADIADHLLGPRDEGRYSYRSFSSLADLTARRLDKEDEALLAKHPELRELVEKCRVQIVETELARGETPTAATSPAWELGSLWGTDLLMRLMTAVGVQGFRLPTGWRKTGATSKVCTLTQLASVTYPLPGDTPEEFARLVGGAVAGGQLAEKQLLELAFLAPQWSRFVERALGWEGFTEALYWFIAHMSYAFRVTEQAAAGAGIEEGDEVEKTETGEEGEQEQEKPSAWDRLIAERTALPVQDRAAGAVDVGWFRRTHEAITPKRWQAMAEAAKFAANAAQARRAQFVADVLTGKASRKQLIDGVRKSKLKDYVRLLGLYPLALGAKRDSDLVERYNVLQEYRRYARGLSAMSKPDALRAVEIGMQNLASTAGYPDPLRLEWALEAEQVRELAQGAVTAKKDGVMITLVLDEQGQPKMTVVKGNKPLKSIPPALKKDKRIGDLAEQATHLKRQASRMKASLEAAMCRGDSFSAAELVQLSGHAILAPLLNRLVLVGEGIMGYPDKGGKTLRDPRGKLEPIKKSETLRIAHAFDLLESGEWDKYQHECFRAERVQPFKQVFRELYVVTKQERRGGTLSRRYAGQQVQPKQGFALWGQRGWGTQDGVWKTFHDVGITASVDFKYGAFTPLEVEGLTIESVEFRRRDEHKPLKLVDVPPRLFSEVMRDMDLVVSVAHRGGVDPEASASTVEMRARLLRETCELLGLKNVRIKDSHALIDGELAHYSLHLGSAGVHRLPGGAVCLVAVPAQHRGRLFLPFADDDPRTAEVIAKTILLARDSEIQDPTILEQIAR